MDPDYNSLKRRKQMGKFGSLHNQMNFNDLLGVFDYLPSVFVDPVPTYPPVNVYKDGEKYFVEVAVAGFLPEELTVSVEKHTLTIKGEKAGKVEREYLKKGIAQRSFTRQFVLGKNVVVHESKLENGILVVELENVVPEDQKPRVIPVKSSESSKLIPKG